MVTFAMCGILILGLVVVLVGEDTGAWTVVPLYSANSCRLHVAGRTYLNPGHCGDGGKKLCWSHRHVQSIDDGLLARQISILSVGGISTVYVPPTRSDASPTVVLIPRGSCYVPYALSGGP
jgi:hypothetical protein